MTKLNRNGRSVRRAFSLLELLAVVTILGIIATIVVPRLGLHVFRAKEQSCHTYRADLNKALEKYIFEHGDAPENLSVLVDEGYYPEAIPNCPADVTLYTIDATTKRIAGHDH